MNDLSDEVTRLRAELAASQRTITILMDRIEADAPTVDSDLGRSGIVLQELVRRRTRELNYLNEGLIRTGIQRRRLDRLLSEMQRLADIGGWDLDLQTNEVELTEHAYAVLQLPAAERCTLDALLHAFSRTGGDALLALVNGMRQTKVPFDIEVSLRSGRLIKIVGHPLEESHEVTHLYGAVMDITDQRLAETQLAEARRLESIGQLAAGIAHEINTPAQYVCDNVRFVEAEVKNILQLVQAYAIAIEPMHETTESNDRFAEVASMRDSMDYDALEREIPRALFQSLEGLERVSAIVKAMKDFSHPGSVRKQPADLNRAIASTIEVSRSRWKFIATIETQFDDLLPPIPCLVADFNQVILNLIVNAADALAMVHEMSDHPTGRIVISTKVVGEFVEIAVSDNGAGIPDNVKDRLFDPFFTTKAVGKGTGQGLTISRNVIHKKHGGRLWFQSTIGRGTTFFIQLPLEEVDLQQPAQTPEAA